MNSVVQGDTIVFEAILTDTDGTALTNATAGLNIVDSTGSTVFSGQGTHITEGTYQRYQNTTSWGTGPIMEYWRFTNAAGTITQVVGNKFRIVGTQTLQPYVWPHELYAYYENIEGFFDGSELERVWDSYNFINQQLNTLGHHLPVVIGTDGYYDQSLRDWNAWDALYRIVSPRMVSQIKSDEEKPWFDYFKKRADEKWEQFRTKRIVLNAQQAPGEVGIQPGTKVGGTYAGQMETNWGGYGNGFTGADFPRTWRVEVIGTGTSGGIAEGTYRWSNDNGLTWTGTLLTTQEWTYLKEEVYVRFHRGTSTGTTNLWTTSDVWQFKTSPYKLSSGGKSSAKSY